MTGWRMTKGFFDAYTAYTGKNLTFISVLSRHKTQVLGSLESLDKCFEVSQHQCCLLIWCSNMLDPQETSRPLAEIRRLSIRISTQVQAILKGRQLHLKGKSIDFAGRNDLIESYPIKHGKSMVDSRLLLWGHGIFEMYLMCIFSNTYPHKKGI